MLIGVMIFLIVIFVFFYEYILCNYVSNLGLRGFDRGCLIFFIGF